MNPQAKFMDFWVRATAAGALVGVCLGLLPGCGAGPVGKIEVSNIRWNCKARPCRVGFDLTNPTPRALRVVVEVRGYNTTADWGPPPPKLFAGKREIRETVASGQTRHLEVPIKFSRIPREIEVQVLSAAPGKNS